MTDVTNILGQIEEGDPAAAEKLLPLVYDELRKLAAARMAEEKSDHTLQATALVHEAYVRLVDVQKAQQWNSRGHFFAAAAEAMRRILVDYARKADRLKRGGGHQRQDIDMQRLSSPEKREELLAVDLALEKLAAQKKQAVDLVKLRYFAGFTNEEAAQILEISPRKSFQLWAYAKSFLMTEIDADERKNDSA